MRVRLIALAMAAAAALAAAGAQAQSTGHAGHGAQPAGRATPATAAKPQGKFIHPGDKNKDQRIDAAEWVAMGEVRSAFAKADKNRDGKLDGPEFVAAKYTDLTRR